MVSFHGYDASRYFKENGDNCYQYLFDRADIITTPSFIMKNELMKRGCGPKKVHVHRNGVDLKSLNCHFKKDNTATINLLTVARLVEKKGLEYSLKAVATSHYRKKIKYRIIGDGPLKNSLQAIAKHLGIENHVKFLGGQAINEVIKEMSNADIFLLNSITAQDGDMEGIPVSLIQAQAMGLPVVSSYHAGIPELVIDGETGFLTEEKKVSQIAERLDKLVSDSQLRKTFSDNAQRRIKGEFDIERLNDRLKGYFEIGFEGKQFIKKADSNETIKDLSQIKTKFQNLESNQRIYTYEKYFEYAEIFNGQGTTDISIIIICEKYSDDLSMNLKILNNQRSHNFQLILVNNGSKDSKFVKLKNYIDVYIKLNKNTGAYFSRNVAALFVNSPILLFLDDDGVPETNLIEAHLNAFKNFDVIAVRGVCLPKTDNQLNYLAKHYYLGDKPFPVYADIEGNTSYLADAFFKAGGWDDEIVFGGGGVDLSRRLLDIEPDMRKQIYSPDPVIFHDFAKDSNHLKYKQKKQEKSRLRLRKKHHDYDVFLRSWIPFFKRDDLIIRKKIEKKSEEVRFFQPGTIDSSQNNIRSINAKGIQKPKFSICIPTYNRAKFLKDSVQSALDQNYENFEIVIVDDGSTDNTETIAKSFGSAKIRYIRKVHENAATTRNRCIEAAKGDYIVWLDDDDTLAPGILGKYFNVIKKEPLTNVIYGQINYFENTTGESIRTYNPTDWGNNKQALLRALIKGCVIPNPGTLVKKSLYEKVGQYNVEFLRAHDYEFWTRAVKHAQLKKIDEIVAQYRVHDNNLSIGAFIDKSFESKIIRNMVQRYSMEEIFSDFQWEKYSKTTADANYLVAKSLMEYNDYLNAKLFLESIPLNDMNAEMLEMRYRCDLFSGDSDRLRNTIEQQRPLQILSEDTDLKLKKFCGQYIQIIKKGQKQVIQNKYIEAGKTVKQILEKFGTTFDSMLLAAQIMTKTGKKTQAFNFLKQAVICGPHHLKSIPPVCLNSLSTEEQKELYKINERLISNQNANLIQGGIDVENYEKMYQGIQPLLNSSKPEDAITVLKNLVDSFPEFAQAHNDLGVLYYGAGEKQAALTHYEKAVQLEPGNITFKKNLADFYYVEQNRVEDAMKLYVDVLAIQPEDIETLLITGHICIAMERFEDAEVFYNRILEIEPWNADASEVLEKLQNRGQEPAPTRTTEDIYPQAESQMAGNDPANVKVELLHNKGLEKSPTQTAEEMYQQAQTLMEGNDPEPVIKALEDILMTFSDFALAHNDLGVLYYNTGDKDKALMHYEQAARLETGNITFKKNLADFYFVEQNRVEEALQLYVDVLAIQPEDVETLLITGHICVSLHKFDDAKVFYNRVLEIEPWNADARQNLETLESKRQAV
jgi:glycosyltransferase involved in cell wall biosynthesis/Flp pilus assembly protein TadD